MATNSLFLKSDYREFLKAAIERAKAARGKCTLRSLSESTAIQSTYLTNVLMGRSHLNQDQLYALAEPLNLSLEEQTFASLLLEMDRSANPKRKKVLTAQVEALKKNYLKTAKHLPVKEISANIAEDEYYLDPMTLIVHVFLRIPKYAKNPTMIATELKLSSPQYEKIIKLLETNGIIRWDTKARQYIVEKHSRHLAPDSPLCQPHQMLLRMRSMQRTQELSDENRNSISLTYFANRKVRQQIHVEFLNFLKAADKLAKQSQEDNEVFQMNFDLFPWSAV